MPIKKYLHDIDLDLNQLLNARIHPITTVARLALTPTTGDVAFMVYDIDENNLYIWDGTAWGQVNISPQDIINWNYAYDKTVQSISISGPGDVKTVTLTRQDSTTISDTVTLSYVHDQQTASATWNVTHNLNKYPSVSIVDTAGDEVIGEVHFNNANSITITFTAAFSGKAFIN